MKHLDLFSGIGGFAIAAREVGWTTVGFSEIDPFCNAVLKRRFDCDRWFSVSRPEPSGPAPGVDWTAELVGIEADWLVIENTYHRWRAWVPELRRLLWHSGYASVCFRVRASEVGAVHHRARAWLVANSDSEQLRELSRWWHGQGREVAAELARSWDSAPQRLGANDGLSAELDEARRHALGNAIVPRAAELIFRGIKAVMSSGDSGSEG